MKTSINGKVRIKFFWGCAYSGRGMTPVQQLLRIGRLRVYKVVYARFDPFDARYYKESALASLRKQFRVNWCETPTGDDYWYEIRSVIDNGYIGTPEDAYRLMQRGLINVQNADSKANTCSIGYHPIEKKWYGWSHRAMYGFGIGDTVKKGDCCASSGWTEEYLLEHPEADKRLPIGFKARSMDDAKTMAIAFAESVS